MTGLADLAFGSFRRPGGPWRLGLALDGDVVDLDALAAGSLSGAAADVVAGAPDLDRLLAAGPAAWAELRAALADIDPEAAVRVPVAEVELGMPFTVADYVDFYSSLDHVRNAGLILRPDADPLPPAWRHLPIGYHGRAGTVVAGGTPVVRPCGQLGPDAFGPTRKLDFELELAFVTGPGPPAGERTPVGEAEERIFGLLLLDDWSARDIQAFESRPLGPFLGKSFATSIAPWVVPLPALAAHRVPGPPQDPEPLPHLRAGAHPAFDVALEAELRTTDDRAAGRPGTIVTRTNARRLYWSPAQQLAHATVNGAAVRAGDLFASGTVSGPDRGNRGCLLELTFDGAEPLALDGGRTRAYLEDGDELILRGRAGAVDFGEVAGIVLPARP